MKITVRAIVVAGALSAIAIILGATRLGFIPFVLGVSITIMHVAVIIGAVLEGPIVGTIIGLIFGLFSLIWAFTSAGVDVFFQNPLISVVPRLFIGLFAYLVYRALREPRPWKMLVALGGVIAVIGALLVIAYATPILADYGAGRAATLRAQADSLEAKAAMLRQVAPLLRGSGLGEKTSDLLLQHAADYEQQVPNLRWQADVAERPATWQTILLVSAGVLLVVMLAGLYLALRHRVLQRWGEVLAIVAAAVAGTLTNTVLVLTAIGLAGSWGLVPAVPWGLLLAIGLVNGPLEIVAAVLITVAVVAAWKQIEFGRKGARILREG